MGMICRSLILAGLAMLAAGSSVCQAADDAPASRFGVYGSNTIGAQLMPALIERYGDSIQATAEKHIGSNPEEVSIVLKANGQELAAIDLQSHGSGTSAPGLASKKAQIGMSSRPIKPEEVKTVTAAGMTVQPHVVALDGLLVFVSPDNPLSALTMDQVAKIFSGQITDWAQLGQKPRKINLYRRDDKSGTYDSFNHLVLQPFKLKIAPDAKKYESSPDLSDDVARDPDGIGFAGFAYLRNAKALNIAGSCGMNSAPTPFNVKSEEYPLSRRLYLYTTNATSAPQAMKLVEFSLSDAAQDAVTQSGYIDQSPDYLEFSMQADRIASSLNVPDTDFVLKDMRGLMNEIRSARRMSTTFRFQSNSFQLDEKAQQDVKRLARLLTAPVLRNKQILLAGFGDGAGPYAAGIAISNSRANAVKAALIQAGGKDVNPARIITKSYGKMMPVACNDSDAGRQRNRRVEIWVRN
jgi:phosphate transport system substrate-binding protein